MCVCVCARNCVCVSLCSKSSLFSSYLLKPIMRSQAHLNALPPDHFILFLFASSPPCPLPSLPACLLLPLPVLGCFYCPPPRVKGISVHTPCRRAFTIFAANSAAADAAVLANGQNRPNIYASRYIMQHFKRTRRRAASIACVNTRNYLPRVIPDIARFANKVFSISCICKFGAIA